MTSRSLVFLIVLYLALESITNAQVLRVAELSTGRMFFPRRKPCCLSV